MRADVSLRSSDPRRTSRVLRSQGLVCMYGRHGEVWSFGVKGSMKKQSRAKKPGGYVAARDRFS